MAELSRSLHNPHTTHNSSIHSDEKCQLRNLIAVIIWPLPVPLINSPTRAASRFFVETKPPFILLISTSSQQVYCITNQYSTQRLTKRKNSKEVADPTERLAKEWGKDYIEMLRKAILSMAFHSLNLLSQNVDFPSLILQKIMCISVGSKGNFKVPFLGGRE